MGQFNDLGLRIEIKLDAPLVGAILDGFLHQALILEMP